jgi:CRISPR-associated protein Csb1
MPTAPAAPQKKDDFDSWADDLRGPVALHLRQALVPVEGKDGILFPPTYAMSDERKYGPYAMDELSDGTKVVQIDSVGSQANRMEPLFRKAAEGRPENPLAALVPQVEIQIENGTAVSILDIGHRIGDALVRSSTLYKEVKAAFDAYRTRGDAAPIAKLAPTSIVFGAWDSRGEHAKLPRIVQSVIRARDVEPLRRSAQYEPPVDYAALEVFSEEDKQKAEGDTKSPLAKRGFVHVPAVDTHGGVVARGGIFRDVTVNLVALRQLDSKENGLALRRYILALALIAATEPQDGFLRQGCLLTPDPDSPSHWTLVERTGNRTTIGLSTETLREYARAAAQAFGVGPDQNATFSRDLAKADLPESKNVKAKPQKEAAKN